MIYYHMYLIRVSECENIDMVHEFIKNRSIDMVESTFYFTLNADNRTIHSRVGRVNCI